MRRQFIYDHSSGLIVPGRAERVLVGKRLCSLFGGVGPAFLAGCGATGPSPSSVWWNVNDFAKAGGSDPTFTNSKRTANVANSNCTLRGSSGRNAGKWYAECVPAGSSDVDGADGYRVGFANGATSFAYNSSGYVVGYDNFFLRGDSYADTLRYINPPYSSFNRGTVVGMAIQVGSGIDVYANNVYLHTAAWTDATAFPFAANSGLINAVFQMAWAGGDQTYTPPSGYTPFGAPTALDLVNAINVPSGYTSNTNRWTVSNGNLTLSNYNPAGGGLYGIATIKANTAKVKGKWYFELLATTVGGGTDIGVGVMDAAATAVNDPTSGSGRGDTWIRANGQSFSDGANIYNGPSFPWANGDVIGVACDVGTGVKFYLNNSLKFTISLTTAVIMPFIIEQGGSQNMGTLRFTAASQTYSPPAGYTAWDDAA